MTENDLLAAVLDLAKVLGWKVAHFRPAMTAKGWRTPVSANGKGFPDLVLARKGRVVFVELKADKAYLRPEQKAWANEIMGEPTHRTINLCYVWRPSDWPERIQRVLEGTLYPASLDQEDR